MAVNIALEGTGASIAFATSGFASNLISLTLPEATREVIDTTHLGTTGAKTKKPAKLKMVGDIQAVFDHNPAASKLIDQDPETITISYPLRTGETTPTKLQFTGFAISEGGEEMTIDAGMQTAVTLAVKGDITVIAAT